MSDYVELISLLEQAKDLLLVPTNDFIWSSWEDSVAAISEIDDIIKGLAKGNNSKLTQLQIVFLPTGPMQEVSLSSDWGEKFLKLAEQCNNELSKNT